MALSFYEAKQRLLSGVPLTWVKFGDHKEGSVHLASAGTRRLFHFTVSMAEITSIVADDLNVRDEGGYRQAGDCAAQLELLEQIEARLMT